MRKKVVSAMLCMAMAATMLAGCGGNAGKQQEDCRRKGRGGHLGLLRDGCSEEHDAGHH